MGATFIIIKRKICNRKELISDKKSGISSLKEEKEAIIAK